MAVINIAEIVAAAEQFGLFEVVLPFLMTFTIFFGILESIKFFGENQRIQGAISFIAALFVIMSPMGPALANFFSIFFAQMGAVLVGGLFLLMTFYLLYALWQNPEKFQDDKKPWGAKMIWVAAIVVLIAFANAGGLELFGISSNSVGGVEVSPDTVALFGLIGLVVLIFAAIIGSAKKKEEERKEEKAHEKFLKKIIGK